MGLSISIGIRSLDNKKKILGDNYHVILMGLHYWDFHGFLNGIIIIYGYMIYTYNFSNLSG